MNEDQAKLASEISEILKDQSLTAEERLIKMKHKIDSQKTSAEINQPPLDTYNSKDIKKAALRNSLLNKKK